MQLLKRSNFLILVSFIISFKLISCSFKERESEQNDSAIPYLKEGYQANKFSFPISKKDTTGYYNAQGFGGKHHHLGEDWNGNGGGDSDLGDPVYSCANGFVKETKDHKGGWGNVIRVLHFMKNDTVESLYAHVDTILVKEGTWIKRGKQVGTIGTAHGKYKAHLHFELRSNIKMSLGSGYSKNNKGFLNPTEFILKHQ